MPHPYPISEISEEIIELLRKEGGGGDKEAGDLIFTILDPGGEKFSGRWGTVHLSNT